MTSLYTTSTTDLHTLRSLSLTAKQIAHWMRASPDAAELMMGSEPERVAA